VGGISRKYQSQKYKIIQTQRCKLRIAVKKKEFLSKNICLFVYLSKYAYEEFRKNIHLKEIN